MVVICDKPFDIEGYDKAFSDIAPFTLSDFQKWAIKGIIDKDHVLVTAHTGSGKTLPAEFIMKHFTTMADESGRKRKKVIYASPIKALSNQKLHDLRKKFPDISFGLLTGDCKDNPDADVLIMTTEILRNTLFAKKIASKTDEEHFINQLSFEMDVETELGGVIFDEVHYINDKDRGSVWEQCILMLPPQVQILMLSATIDKPESFAAWVETEKNKQASKNSIEHKNVILAPTYKRVVPLTHYMWMDVNSSSLKKINKQDASYLTRTCNKLIEVKSSNGKYITENYKKISKAKKIIYENRMYVNKKYILNNLALHMKENEMLPAICFVFSRKQVEQCANSIQHSMFKEGEKFPSTAEKDCRKLLMSKFPNYKEYVELTEYRTMVKLLEKGIAIHHAGVIPVLREMVELLFDKGYIRILFATETFSVGINMPTKTVLFTSLQKYDGSSGHRYLYPHEYTQMAGRAGRRGLDKLGRVIHCNNLFDAGYDKDYKNVLCGAPQVLVSKFKISYSLLLNIMDSGETNYDLMEEFVNQSMIRKEIISEVNYHKNAIEDFKEKETSMKKNTTFNVTPKAVIEKYIELSKKLEFSSNKQKKKITRELNNLVNENKRLKKEVEQYKDIDNLNEKIVKHTMWRDNAENYLHYEIEKISDILLENNFINKSEDGFQLTDKGRNASQFQEVHPLAFSDIYDETNQFESFDSSEIACIASLFANIRVNNEMKVPLPNTDNSELNNIAKNLKDRIDKYVNIESRVQANTGSFDEINYDLMQTVLEWCNNVESEKDCMAIINKIKLEKEVFLGDFVKAILKINNIAAELEKVAEINNNIPLLEKLRKIPELSLKYVATNNSLYI